MSRKTPQFSQESSVMLDTLREAVQQTLERKRKLGEYAVFWQDGKVVFVGEDAPKQES
ncbi:hypothetical protein [Lacimicrobium alkaliphilum]|uniref:Uncharacterized protein n=1 Tax=Lacimicrobium alkaliphilum TaxID=1526571 RepID=A0ABQ1R468_9ALTE|nr:hypothetical protein [Lacimicrobium alkaliphilum]GGD57549.1 hypothetical protein GCM10011357_11200 [Lacimicrobium alkaliphilum]